MRTPLQAVYLGKCTQLYINTIMGRPRVGNRIGGPEANDWRAQRMLGDLKLPQIKEDAALLRRPLVLKGGLV